MPDNEILITTRYDSIGDAELQRTYDRLLSKVNQIGYSFQNVGRLIGSDFVQDVGRAISAVDDLARTVDGVAAAIKKVPALGKIGAGAAGAFIGSKIYDATIGAAQGTDTATILNQIKELFRVGFNVDQLKVEARIAMIEGMVAENSKFKYDPNNIGDINERLKGTGISVSSGSAASLQQAVQDTQKLLDLRIKEGDQVGSTVAQVATALKILQAAYDQAVAAEDAAKKKLAQPMVASMNAAYSQAQRGQAYLSQAAGIRSDFSSARTELSKRYAELERDIAQSRIAAAQSYAADIKAIDESYYSSRLKLAQQYGLEAQRAEEDHQRNMRRLSEDHGKRLRKLAESRDALAIEDEVDSYRTEQRRAEEDYQVQAARRSEDYARQLQELADNYNRQRQARYNQYQQELNDIAQHYANQRQLIAEWFTAIENDIRQRIVNLTNQITGNSAAADQPHWTGPSNKNVTQYFQLNNASDPQMVYDMAHKAIRDVFSQVS